MEKVAVIEQEELDRLSGQAEAAQKLAKKVTVSSETEALGASEVLTQIKLRASTLEEKRKEITQPINKALKSINDLFRPMTTILADAETAVKGQVKDWIDREEAAAETEENRRRKIQQAHADKGHNTNLPAYIDRPDRNYGNITVRRVMKFQVVDPAAVPPDFLAPDMDKIRAAIAEGAHNIPGVEVGYENQVAVRIK